MEGLVRSIRLSPTAAESHVCRRVAGADVSTQPFRAKFKAADSSLSEKVPSFPSLCTFSQRNSVIRYTMGFGDVVQMVAPVLAPLHLLAFSTLLGTELYQTFVITKVCYNALPRSAFTTLQKHIFPLYFQGQTALLVVVAATVPPHGPVSFVGSRFDWVPLLIAGVTAGLNFMLYGPRTRQAMIDRIHQGKCQRRVPSQQSG